MDSKTENSKIAIKKLNQTIINKDEEIADLK